MRTLERTKLVTNMEIVVVPDPEPEKIPEPKPPRRECCICGKRDPNLSPGCFHDGSFRWIT